MKTSDKFLTTYLLAFPLLNTALLKSVPELTILSSLALTTLPAVPIHFKLSLKEEKEEDKRGD